MDKDPITLDAIARHQELEQMYYQDHSISKVVFDRLHGENWETLRIKRGQPHPDEAKG